MKGIFIFLFANMVLFIASAESQTLITRDAMNSFAKFSDSKNIKDLESARKLIDNSYKTRSDTNSFKVNLVRGIVYATLARADSNRKFNYVKDPVLEALHSLKIIKDSKYSEDALQEIVYINDQLNHTYLHRANTFFRERKFSEALAYFSKLDSVKHNNFALTHNLALLHQEMGNYEQSITYFEKLIDKRPRPEYFLVLSNLYESLGDEDKMLRILRDGSNQFPSNRDIIFKLINTLLNRNDYIEIAKFTEAALELDEFNINLNYLAAFSNEITGNDIKAEAYYKDVLNINPNNYDGNYSLGLLYLNLYLKDTSKENLMYVSKYYLLKANEIDPNELKSLTSLSVLYKYTGDKDELEKINNRINQFKLN